MAFQLYGQVSESSGFNFVVEGGKMLMHNPSFGFTNERLNGMLRLQYETQVGKSTYWGEYYNYPRIAFELNYLRYSDYKIMGGSLGLIGIVKAPLIRIKSSTLDLHVGTGIAFFDRVHDPINNPGNTAISLHLNNLTHFGLRYNYNINELQAFELGVSFWHSSNGSTEKPNIGINSFHYGIGYKHHIEEKSFLRDRKPDYRPSFSRFQLELNGSLSSYKRGKRWESRYLSSSYESLLRLRTYRTIYLAGGFMAELSLYDVDFLLNTHQEYSRAAARKAALRLGTSLGTEFVFGNVGMGIAYGYYLKPARSTYDYYGKLYVRYYIRTESRWLPDFFTGVVLKAHGLAAEYVALRVGVVF